MSSDTITAAKTLMRAHAKALRAALAPQARQAASLAIAEIALSFLPSLPAPGAIVGGFMPIGEEISPLPLMAKLRDQGYGLALPVMMGKNRPLQFRTYKLGDALIPAVWGIREPASDQPSVTPDIVLTALLAFDDAGYRLGYGGGYYDRTISATRAHRSLVTIGLAYDEQRVDAVPHLDYDEPVDWILTPSGARRTRS